MSKQASSVDWPTVMKYLAGGALLGAGTGSAVSALRHIQALREKARAQGDTTYDDDVAYVTIPKKASANPNSGTTFALSGLAALLGGYGTYSLVRKAYRDQRRKQLQAELDKAQQIYLDDLAGQQKQADFSLMTKGVGSAYLALLLTALGGGVVTNKLLQKQFPTPKSPNRGKPRKIVLRTAGSPEEQVETPKGEVTPDALEGLTRTVMAKKARAEASGLQDLIAALSHGRADEIDRVFHAGLGTEGVFTLVKGAAQLPLDPVSCNLALGLLCSDALYKNAFAPLIAAEYHDMAPYQCKVASYIEPEFQDDLQGLVEAFPREMRHKAFQPLMPEGVKTAAAIDDVLDPSILSMTLRQVLDNQEEKTPADTGSNVASSIQSDSFTSEDNPIFEVDDQAAEQFRRRNQEVLTNAFKKL